MPSWNGGSCRALHHWARECPRCEALERVAEKPVEVWAGTVCGSGVCGLGTPGEAGRWEAARFCRALQNPPGQSRCCGTAEGQCQPERRVAEALGEGSCRALHHWARERPRCEVVSTCGEFRGSSSFSVGTSPWPAGLDAGGIPAFSRWLSLATRPVTGFRRRASQQGCQPRQDADLTPLYGSRTPVVIA